MSLTMTPSGNAWTVELRSIGEHRGPPMRTLFGCVRKEKIIVWSDDAGPRSQLDRPDTGNTFNADHAPFSRHTLERTFAVHSSPVSAKRTRVLGGSRYPLAPSEQVSTYHTM